MRDRYDCLLMIALCMRGNAGSYVVPLHDQPSGIERVIGWVSDNPIHRQTYRPG
jgi:hypothetical protein